MRRVWWRIMARYHIRMSGRRLSRIKRRGVASMSVRDAMWHISSSVHHKQRAEKFFARIKGAI